MPVKMLVSAHIRDHDGNAVSAIAEFVQISPWIKHNLKDANPQPGRCPSTVDLIQCHDEEGNLFTWSPLGWGKPK